MNLTSRMGVTAKVRMIITLAALANLLLLAAGVYHFSLYENNRRDISQVDLPMADGMSEMHKTLVEIQTDLNRLMEDAKQGRIDERTAYHRGRELIDRMDVLKRHWVALDRELAGKRTMDSTRFPLHLDRYRGNLVSGIEMISVDLTSAERYIHRAAQEALAINRVVVEHLDQIRHIMDESSRALKRALFRLALPVVLLIVLAAAITFWLLRNLATSITRTFTSVQETLGRLRDGDTDFEINTVAPTRESRDMATALETFRQTLAELATLRANLEWQVEDRTWRLQEANRKLGDKLVQISTTERELLLYKKVFESTSEAIVITSLDPSIVDVNPAYTTTTGYTREEVLGRNPNIASSRRHDSAFFKAMWNDIIDKGHWSGEMWDKRRNGEVYPKLLSINTVYDDQQQPVNYVGVFTDISPIKEAERKLEQLAYFDRLTDLPNRRLVLDRIDHALALARRGGNYGSLFFLDLDNFKQINDTLGHQVGDQLLVEVAKRLKACVRSSDTVGRLAGDEFLVLAEDLSRDARQATLMACKMGEKFVEALSQPYVLLDIKCHCSTSVGITLVGGDANDVEILLNRADMAMYEAKKGGRNTLRLFDPGMQESQRTRVKLESRLRKALRKGYFSLLMQPQFDAEYQIVSVEALIRWNDPERGTILPGEFIPLVEETHLVQEIDQWVLKTVCARLKAWEGDPLLAEVVVAVNISGMHFTSDNFVPQLEALLARYAIDPSRLKLELTESVVMGDLEVSVAKMQSLQSLGIRLSMDDFGTGYSSLAYLRRMPFDQVKIDRSFVSRMLEDSNDRFIVQAVLTMGELMEVEVMAEGVETVQQHETLIELGCGLFQGHLFSKPLPMDACETLIRDRHS